MRLELYKRNRHCTCEACAEKRSRVTARLSLGMSILTETFKLLDIYTKRTTKAIHVAGLTWDKLNNQGAKNEGI